MMINPLIEQYAEQHTSKDNALLHTIYRETHLEVLRPQMLSGQTQGRFLAMLSQMIRPQTILEIGTYTGYSTLCLAEGLRAEGVIYTIDKNEELETRVKGYFAKSKYATQIKYLVGNAVDIVPTLDEKFDLVFIDADKKNYSFYYDQVFERIKPGGFILVDNVLWYGKVIDTQKKDEDTEAIRKFNEKVNQDYRVENVILTIRDGLMLVRKL